MKKKLLLGLIVAIIGVFGLGLYAFAANNVSDIAIEVTLYEDGSAVIVQTWNCDFEEGTEAYFPLENLKGMTLSDFSVMDENGSYTYLEHWDVSANFDEKAKKCGIVDTEQGYELCWGITEYGQKRYAIQYKLSGLVGSYEDYDGLNFQFIGSNMGTLPTDATVKIMTHDGTALSAENCGIWAFGFDGQIEFKENQVLAYTETPLTKGSDSVIIMIQLNKGVLTPIRMEKGTFETLKGNALDNSDYDLGPENSNVSSDSEAYDLGEMGFFDKVLEVIILSILVLIPLSPFLYLAFWLIRTYRRKLPLKKLYAATTYYREPPIEGNIEAVMALASRFEQSDDDGNLIAAIFLKLIHTGSLEPLTEKSIGILGREKQYISLKLVRPPNFDSITAQLLYGLLILASGPDGVLQEKELEQYCASHYTSMLDLVKHAKVEGEKTLLEINCYNDEPTEDLNELTENGKSLLMQIIGFKKYLLDFSLISERGISESEIWQDYFVFAALLGVADKAMEQFKAVYPAVTPYQQNAQYYYHLAHRYQRASYYTARATSNARSSGRGGRSSFGGGGGFSGGGRGGGTR
ncbi:DUF2207 domain-containing protein [Fusibacter sp. 3D3]|uniref:DUF2207 family protein n=1 Tax=Fusibacter sp. 3D3 TaxID=1048380 RepID=UPI000853EB86|nr:DUF2207 domain-containing protein [Fusibacter sp. 3D3]GAU79219.1 threonyl-tRNA synthetase [Fusibacter sp. 3D3]